LAVSTSIILFSEMFKFSNTLFLQNKIYDTSLKSRNKGGTTMKQEENKPLSRRKIINIQNPVVF
jgi:hypothetical protein